MKWNVTRGNGHWGKVLERYNLLDATPDDSNDGLEPENNQPHFEARKPKTPTPSEAARQARSSARLSTLHDKEVLLQRICDRLDHWQDDCDNEHKVYRERVELGETEPGQMFFDNVLLQDDRQAMRDFICTEHSVSVARKHACYLGTTLHGTNQKSISPENLDDGYAQSMIDAMKAHVDHERISKWMDGADDRGFHLEECDVWEMVTVNLCDSVIVVAEGKDRRGIDRCCSICEAIEIDTLRKHEERISKS